MTPLETARAHMKLYTAWKCMIKRCTNKKDDRWAQYGGRGIAVDPAWMDYNKFAVDVGLPPSLKHSLDRIDNNGPYAPGNCKWATNKEQCNNKRNNIWLEHAGRRQTLARWAEELGVDDSMIYQRIYRCGWSVERALSAPSRKANLRATRA